MKSVETEFSALRSSEVADLDPYHIRIPAEKAVRIPKKRASVIPEEVNPIEFGSKEIKTTLKELTKKLGEAFPENYQWGAATYKKVFINMESRGQHGGGFSNSDNMLILTPQGELKSGWVEHWVASYTNGWHFNDNELEPAKDIEIIKFGTELAEELFDNLGSELSEKKEIDVVSKSISVQEKRDYYVNKIKKISETALKEMGEEDLEKEEDTDYKMETRKHYKENFKKAKVAISLFKNRNQTIKTLEALKRNGRANPIESELAKLVLIAKQAGIWPEENDNMHKNINQGILLEDPWGTQPVSKRASDLHIYEGDRVWQIMITDDNKIMEIQPYFSDHKPRRKAENIISYATLIADSIICMSVAEILPNIEWNY